jgi:hypothetical protein
MKRIAVGGIVVTLLSLLAGAVAYAGSDDSRSQSDVETLKFQVKFSPFNYLDLGKQGPSLGDETLFHDILNATARVWARKRGSAK